jgi:hypothetical protein
MTLRIALEKQRRAFSHACTCMLVSTLSPAVQTRNVFETEFDLEYVVVQVQAYQRTGPAMCPRTSRRAGSQGAFSWASASPSTLGDNLHGYSVEAERCSVLAPRFELELAFWFHKDFVSLVLTKSVPKLY